MQSTHGNAHVARLLAQQRAGVLGRMPIRRGAGHGSLAEAETAQVYERPNESSKVVGELAKGKTVDLTSDDGDFYGVVFDATKGYVKSSELATAIDELPAAKDAEFAARAKAADRRDRRRRPRRGQGPARHRHGAGDRAGTRCPTGSASSSSSSRWSPRGRRRRRPPSRSSTTT